MAFSLGGFYDTGAVTVTAGSVNVTSTSTTWVDIMQGDHLWVGGLIGLIESVNPDTGTMVLRKPWPGPTLTNTPYVIAKMSWLRYDPAEEADQVRQIRELLVFIGFLYHANSPLTEPDPDIGNDGQWAIKTDVVPWKMWLKVGGVWVLQSPATADYSQTISISGASQVYTSAHNWAVVRRSNGGANMIDALGVGAAIGTRVTVVNASSGYLAIHGDTSASLDDVPTGSANQWVYLGPYQSATFFKATSTGWYSIDKPAKINAIGGLEWQVSNSGTDVNSGLTTGNAFATIQKAEQMRHQCFGSVSAKAQPGSYAGFFVYSVILGTTTFAVSSTGPAARDTTVIQANGGNVVDVQDHAGLTISDVTIQTSGASPTNLINSRQFCIVDANNIRYGNTNNATAIGVSDQAILTANGGVVAGNFAQFASVGGNSRMNMSGAWSIPSPRTFAQFIGVGDLASVNLSGLTWSGAGAGTASSGARVAGGGFSVVSPLAQMQALPGNSDGLVFNQNPGLGTAANPAYGFLHSPGLGMYGVTGNVGALSSESLDQAIWSNANGFRIKGTPTNSNKPAGWVGEYIEIIQTSASRITLTNNVTANILSQLLQGGDYDVWVKLMWFTVAAWNPVNIRAGISLISANLDGESATSYFPGYNGITAGEFLSQWVHRRLLIPPASQTVYLTAYSNHSGSNPQAWGQMFIRRRA